ncbi:MAG: hypothetical protein DRG30_05810 [Epsilonproteobacteria bacterium]|nr:MAG: hypothetical protein DRG30_05810 [Campylobacterota bacterium]
MKKIISLLILIFTMPLLAGTAYQEGAKAYQTEQYNLALKYFYISARNYNVNAYAKLGIIHDKGLGTGTNKLTALYWYQKAAQRHHPDAQYRLGHLYEMGEGTKKNMKKATFWYQKAARNGNAKAKVRLSGKDPKKELPKDSNKSKGFFGKVSFWK